MEIGKQGPELIVSLVNTSPEEVPDVDTNFYEAWLEVDVGPTLPFVLDDLPDSFRYDRTVPAYGVNCGVRRTASSTFETTDLIRTDQPRPEYWDQETLGEAPELTFRRLALDPLPPLRSLLVAMRRWGERFWSEAERSRRAAADAWTPEMIDEARRAAGEFDDERARLEQGVRLLEEDENLLRSFKLMNLSFQRTVGLKHNAWRPFQIGFLLASLSALASRTNNPDLDTVDTLWFATGGGKTETYLGLVVTAAFLDRITGKRQGITAWARFPLRMLSLQQTQRFANVLAAAELVRQEDNIEGSVFSVGFLVGPGTPNRIPVEPRPGDPDANDPSMPREYQVLLRCPFCDSDDIDMRFDRGRWRLDHWCKNRSCPWNGPLPFHIVDDEIFRFLPTVVVGTLDKAANIALQAAMRGLYAAPLAMCPTAGHGFTYAPRSKTPNGCLVPRCTASPSSLSQDAALFPPRIRIQDELHLLRDSLGAVDSHYEGLLDQLQQSVGSRAKCVASSATIAGYREQVEVLYQKRGRLFPLPGPRATSSFWSKSSTRLARIFVGLAPRGVTLDYATDRSNEALQRAVRRALVEPATVAAAAGVAEASIPGLALFYGVDVVYGSTLRDVEAAARSFETQIPLDPINSVALTGKTPLEDVREALRRLTDPEPQFDDRIHLVAASSMLSHGVDVDRLNVMVVLGLPLSTAEFIQTTSRVGRRYPGLVFVLHKIGRERDAKVFRSFGPFVQHADRLIDPVPITRRSRRVLELTFPGIFAARVLGIHEPLALSRRLRQLTTPATLRQAFARLPVLEADELRSLMDLLGIRLDPLAEGMRRDVTDYLREVFRQLNDPATTARFVSELLPSDPMRSLRDVEEQVPVFSRGGAT
jgi:hypothetical protein